MTRSRRTAPSRSPWPARTTARGGALLTVAGAVLIARILIAVIPVSVASDVPMRILEGAGGLLLAVALTLLALGIAGEIGIAGSSGVGRVALIAWGFQALVPLVASVLPSTAPAATLAFGETLTVLEFAIAIAGLIGAFTVARARVLGGVARWALIAPAAIGLLLILAELAPILLVQPAAFDGLAVLRPGLLALAGLAMLLHGRGEAVRHRARRLHDAW